MNEFEKTHVLTGLKNGDEYERFLRFSRVTQKRGREKKDASYFFLD